MTVSIVRPTLELCETWAEALAEFGGVDVHGMGMGASAAPDRATCAELVALAERLADPEAELPADTVRCDMFWVVDEADGAREVVGFISFRRELNAYLAYAGGHIGYSIRPSRRRLGYAGEALRLVLEHARAAGHERVMITCDDENAGSARTIERAGGRLADVIDASDVGHPRLRRYWIALAAG
ncbi:GNAT family N-acetyltransferase [Leucobacter zeae]|nr:GNAT family N-acetyltransferase [Leucobacter zeae]